MKGFNVMKVKTTFSTILTLMMLLVFSFDAYAWKNNSEHNFPSRSVSENEAFMADKLGVKNTGNRTTGYAQVSDGTGTHYLYPRHFEPKSSGTTYDVTFVEKTNGDYTYTQSGTSYTCKYVGTGGTHTVLSAAAHVNNPPAGSVRCEDKAATWTETQPTGVNVAKVWKQVSLPNIQYRASFADAPTDIDENQVVIFKVNPYWRGVRRVYDNEKGADSNWSSEWEQVYYGIDDVITEGIVETTIPPTTYQEGNKTITTQGGVLYGYTGKLGRFFFARRRAESAPTTLTEGDYGYKTDWNSSRKMPLRWFDEWTTTPDASTDVGWRDFGSVNQMAKFTAGTAYYAPHNCSSSLETNHFVSVVDIADENKTVDLTVLFYIDKNSKTATEDRDIGKGNGVAKNSVKPFMFGYAAEQYQPNYVDAAHPSTSADKYDINVYFRTNDMNVAPSGVKFYDASSQTGVVEYYEVYRLYNGTETLVGTYSELELNKTTKGEDNETYYTIVDPNFPDGGLTGYYVTYRIVAKLHKVTNGTKSETYLAQAATGEMYVHIPGQNKMEINGSTTSVWTKSKFNHKIEATETLNDYWISDTPGVNTGKHIITGQTGITTATVNGDQLVLYSTRDGVTTEVKRKTYNAGTVKTGTEYYRDSKGKLKQRDVTRPYNVQDAVNDFFNNSTFIEVALATEEDFNALTTYQLKLENGTTAKQYSNTKDLQAYGMSATKGKMHRQGHPHGEAGNPKEILHNEIKFVANVNVPYYFIYKNGEFYRNIQRGQDYTQTVDYTWVDDYAVNYIQTEESGTTKAPTNAIYNVVAVDNSTGTNVLIYGSADLEFAYGAINTETGQPTSTTQDMWDLLVYQGTTPEGKKQTHDVKSEYASFGIRVGFQVTFTPNEVAHAIDIADKTSTGIVRKPYTAELYGVYEINGVETHKPVSEYGTVKKTEEEATTAITFEQYLCPSLEEAGISKTDPVETIKAKTTEYFNSHMPKRVYAKFTIPQGTPNTSQGGNSNSTMVPANLDFAGEGGSSNENVVVYTDNMENDTPTTPIPTGIDDVNTDDTRVSVYPNPATDYITVEGANGSVALYSATGAMVQSVNAQGTVTIDVSGLSKGVYVLKTGNVTEKILIK